MEIRILTDNYLRIKEGIMILFIASLPFYLPISNGLMIIGALLTTAKLFLRRDFNSKDLDTLSVIFLVFFALGVLGLSYTERENLGYGISVLETNKPLILVPLFFLDFAIHSKQRERIFLTFIISCLVGSLICVIVNIYISITEYQTIFHEWRFSHDRISDPIGLKAVYFSIYLSLCVILLLNFILEKFTLLNWSKRVVVTLLFLLFLILIAALGARTITLSLMLILFLNLVAHARERKSVTLSILAVILPAVFVAFILLNPVVYTRFVDVLKSSYDQSNYGSYFARWNIWQPGLELIKENFWLGVGTGDHQTELDKKFIKYGFEEGVETFNMHNQYLQTTLNFGIVGLLVFMIGLIHQVRRGLSTKDYSYLGFLFLFICACLTEAFLSRNKGIIFFLTFSFIFYKTRKTS